MRNPLPTVDVVIELPEGRVVLVRRRKPPQGWALPGGFIEVGETAEEAAVREAGEETGLAVRLETLLQVYSDPDRDPRHHTLTVVFVGQGEGPPRGGSDAALAQAFDADEMPADLAFDHDRILADYRHWRRTGKRPAPAPRRRRLDPDLRRRILRLARECIEAHVAGRGHDTDEAVDTEVFAPGGAFVTLRRRGQLRGCIGSLAADRPLGSLVAEAALSSAFHDPRFPPLEAAECAELDIEVSVLSRPVAAPVDDLVSGFHGVSIELHGRRALFLPQVAREEGWGRRQLLEQLCLKAGLDADAWRDPKARFELFTAEVFGERTEIAGNR